MKPLARLTNLSAVDSDAATPFADGSAPGGRDGHRAADACADLLLDTVPPIMRTLHEVLHEVSQPELTVAQFRTLTFIQKNNGANLSATAEHLGLRLASTSKLVDLLVRRHLLGRAHDRTDRRRMILRITDAGRSLLGQTERLAHVRLAEVLDRLGNDELETLRTGLGLLKGSFFPNGEWHPGRAATSELLLQPSRQE